MWACFRAGVRLFPWAIVVQVIVLAISTQRLGGATGPSEAPGQGDLPHGGLANVLVEGADYSLCARATEIRIARPRLGSPYAIGQAIALLPNNESCSVLFNSLHPGDYRAYFRNDFGILAAADLAVVSRTVEHVVVSDPAVTVQGVVLLDGKPWPDATVELRGRASATSAHIKSDAKGRYVALLPSGGEYELRATGLRNPLVGWTARLAVLPGYQLRDLEFTGGTVEATVSGGIVGQNLSLAVRIGNRTLRESVRVTGDGMAHAMVALPFGEYRIAALQHGGASRETPLILSATAPTASLVLALIDNPSVIVVRDEAGVPVETAVLSGGGQVLAKRQDGSFGLSGVPLGAPITIRAQGFVPTCRLSEEVGVMEVVLERGAPAEFSFSATSEPVPPGSLSGLAGAACPVSLQAFGYVRLPQLREHPNRFRILNLPLSGRVIWQLGQQQSLITLPAALPVMLPGPKTGK